MYAYHGTEYLGAAHGLCSILQMFLTVPGYFDGLPGKHVSLQEGNVNTEHNYPTFEGKIGRLQNSVNNSFKCHLQVGFTFTVIYFYFFLLL